MPSAGNSWRSDSVSSVVAEMREEVIAELVAAADP